MNIQSLPFRTGAGKAQDDGNLLLATWRWVVATEMQWDRHMLTRLGCRREFGDLGHPAPRGRVQRSGLQLTQEAAATMGTPAFWGCWSHNHRCSVLSQAHPSAACLSPCHKPCRDRAWLPHGPAGLGTRETHRSWIPSRRLF